MPRAIEQCDSRRKPTLKIWRQFNMLALAISFGSVGLLVTTAYPQSVSVVTQPEPAAGAKAHVAFAPRAATENGARLSDLSSLDIPSLIRESDRLGTDMHLRLPEYTYLQTRLTREHNQRGKLVQHVSAYEAYPIKFLGQHHHVISLISENGSPISPKRLKTERQQAAKEIEAAEHESALRNSGAPPAAAVKYLSAGIGMSEAGDGVWIGVSQFLRQCQFDAPRYVRLADREMIALNIRSCASNLNAQRERYLEKISGVVWIDAADKVVARLEAWPASTTERDISSETPNAETIVYEQMRLPSGLWVPKRIRLNALGKAALFNGTDKDMTFEFSQYQRFSTEVDDLQHITLKTMP